MDQEPEILFETPRFAVVRQRRQSASGRLRIRETIRHPGAVAVVPILDEDRVCLIRNQRVAVGQTLIELPAGTRDVGESPLETATRELQEETGYHGGSWRPLGTFYLSPGILDEQMHVFVARGLTAGPPAREETEEIENLVVSWTEAMRMIDRGEIRDAKTLVGLLSYDRERRRDA